MNSINKIIIKQIPIALMISFTSTYLIIRPSLDFMAGYDSILARFSKPLLQFTEEEYQTFLKERRIHIANSNANIPLIKILTFPNDVNYEDYKSR